MFLIKIERKGGKRSTYGEFIKFFTEQCVND